MVIVGSTKRGVKRQYRSETRSVRVDGAQHAAAAYSTCGSIKRDRAIAHFERHSHNGAMGEHFSYQWARDSHDNALHARRAVSLLETIIVLFIIGLMMALLFPAVQAARHRALVVQCQNNIRQLQLALGSAVSSLHRFPTQTSWTVDCLRWMEEQPLADAMAQG